MARRSGLRGAVKVGAKSGDRETCGKIGRKYEVRNRAERARKEIMILKSIIVISSIWLKCKYLGDDVLECCGLVGK